MKNIIKKIKFLYKKSGPILFTIRILTRSVKKIRTLMSSLFWKITLKKIGQNVTIEYGVNFEIPYNVTIGNNVFIGKYSEFGSENNLGNLIIGDNVVISKNCKIDHSGNVLIKDNVHISSNCAIYSHNHEYNPKKDPICSDIVIECNAWICEGCMILSNTESISYGVIVGAKSLVNRKCEIDNSIYAGVPVKFIKKIDTLHKSAHEG